MKYVLFGPPGGGKGTFAGQIKKTLPKIPHISTGDIFRENLRNKTELGLKAKKYMGDGTLVPNDVVINMIKDRLSQNDVKENGFLLDGFPRTIEQAEALDEITDIDAFLLLEVSRDIIMKRLTGRVSCPKCNAIYNIYTLPSKKEGICDKCGTELKHRSDDTEETVNNRLDVYEKNAKPIIEHYKNKNLLQKIDSTDTLAMSEEEIKKAIGYQD